MRRILPFVFLLILLITSADDAKAQLLEKAEQFIEKTFGDTTPDTTTFSEKSLTIEERRQLDSIRMHNMANRIDELKNNENRLLTELNNLKMHQISADSVRYAEQMHRIDSLRDVTPGVPVIVEGDTLFRLYAARGGYTPVERARMINDNLLRVSKTKRAVQDSVFLLESEYYIDIMCGDKVIVSLTDQDAIWEGMTRHELARKYAPIISQKLQSLRKGYNFWKFIIRAVLFAGVIILQYLLFRLTNFLFRKLRRRIVRFKQKRLKSIYIRDYELLNKRRIGRILIFASTMLKYIVLLVQLTLTVPILFAIFPQTENLALKIFLYIIEPLKMVAKGVVDYIPNLFIIIVIWYCIKYLVKGVGFIAGEIESEKLKINGFYPDWARPTFNIIRFLLYAFMIAMIYPYLPGSDSGVFQGISVFVGLIISLGSSTVIGNIIAGLVITYMRPFKLGDRIKLNDTVGNVIEKTPFVTRLRTPKNEVVTIPNGFIMSSHTVNYSASARQYGLIIHTTVTIGYDVPWRLINQLLINAALNTPGVLEDPRPFVLETGLEDYYPCYQINAYISDADRIAQIMSDLHQNIQDFFNDAGVEIMSPHYYAGRDGNAITIPTDDLRNE